MDSKYYLFCLKKNNIFLRFCLCIFESDTVKSDCPMQENYEIFKELIHGLQSRPPSPKRAERKVRRRPFREAGSGQNNGTR